MCFFNLNLYFISDRADLTCDSMLDNIQDPTIRYAGTTHEQRSFVNKATRIKMLEWLNASSSDTQLLKLKNTLLDKLKNHTPPRNAVYNYIHSLPLYLPTKGPVRVFLNEMCK